MGEIGILDIFKKTINLKNSLLLHFWTDFHKFGTGGKLRTWICDIRCQNSYSSVIFFYSGQKSKMFRKKSKKFEFDLDLWRSILTLFKKKRYEKNPYSLKLVYPRNEFHHEKNKLSAAYCLKIGSFPENRGGV